MAANTSNLSLEQLSQLPNLGELDIGAQIQTPQIKALYNEHKKLKELMQELFEYTNANPKPVELKKSSEIEHEKAVQKMLEIKKRKVTAQVSVVRTLFRQGAMKVREEKEATAEARKTNDQLLLQLNNLEYEEQSLQAEINAAKGYDHKYNKLSLIPTEEFLEQFPEYKDSSEQELMKARIDHEHQVRVKLEEQRQDKLKKKQLLFADVKKGKDDLTKLDGMLENFIKEAEPIKKALEAEKFDDPEPAKAVEEPNTAHAQVDLRAKDAPIDKAKDAPVDKAKDAPVDRAKDAPADKAKDKSVDKAKDVSVDKAEDAPVDKPVDAQVVDAKGTDKGKEDEKKEEKPASSPSKPEEQGRVWDPPKAPRPRWRNRRYTYRYGPRF